MPLVTEARLKNLCQNILIGMQTPADLAEIVADILVHADVRGADSHGVRLLTMYIRNIEIGAIVPAARPEIIKHDGAVTLIEGNWCFGQVSATLAVQQAVASAQQFGIGAATIVHSLHIGRVGEYPEQIAKHNMLGITLCNANRATAPYGGMERLFGTNPIALAAPRKDGKLISTDFATSAKSINKLQIYRQRGMPLPEGVILDKYGNSSTDPADFFDGGYLLPVGGYKGSALNFFIDVIGGVLIGAGPASMVDRHPGNGTLMLAFDIARWRDPADFDDRLETLLHNVKHAPLQPGFEEIITPGEIEDRAEEQRSVTGIPIDEPTWKELKAAAQKAGVTDSLFTEHP
jgi:LDH2 family malate/lactate/ureidoglycolate dehydrogenase